MVQPEYRKVKGRSTLIYFYYKQSLNHFDNFWNVFLIFSPFCKVVPYKVLTKLNGKIYPAISFRTRSLSVFTLFHNMFYVNGKKIIPKDLYQYLDAVALAYWIVDNGTFKSKGGFELCTDSFTLKEVIYLINILIYFFELKCTLQTKRPGQYRIYISKKSKDSLRKIVAPQLTKSMLYKIHL